MVAARGWEKEVGFVCRFFPPSLVTIPPSVVSRYALASTNLTFTPMPAKRKDAPPRRTSAYALFSAEFRASLSKEESSSLAEVSKKLGEEWKKLEDKSKYEAMAEEKNKEIDEAIREHKKMARQKEREEREEDTKKTTKTKKKPAVSAYILFANETRPSLLANETSMSFGEVSKQIGHMWKALDASEKEAWQAKAAEANQKQKEEEEEEEE